MSQKIDLLIIDDDNGILTTLRRMAQGIDLKVACFTRDAEAITFIRACKKNSLPSFYLLDMHLKSKNHHPESSDDDTKDFIDTATAKALYMFLQRQNISIENITFMTAHPTARAKQVLKELGESVLLKNTITKKYFSNLYEKIRSKK